MGLGLVETHFSCGFPSEYRTYETVLVALKYQTVYVKFFHKRLLLSNKTNYAGLKRPHWCG